MLLWQSSSLFLEAGESRRALEGFLQLQQVQLWPEGRGGMATAEGGGAAAA